MCRGIEKRLYAAIVETLMANLDSSLYPLVRLVPKQEATDELRLRCLA